MFISCKESRIENNRSFYGCFYLGPFGPSQSLTVANALRRTLLSESTGLAIISVQIENAHHEYSTLPGVKESVLDILLNLREIVFKKVSNTNRIYKNKGVSSIYEQDLNGSITFFKPIVGYLKVNGPGVIRAKDLSLPPFIQMVDPSQYIATLADDGCLNIKFVIMEGKNQLIQKNPIQSIPHENKVLLQRNILLNQLKDIIKNSTKRSEFSDVHPKKTDRKKNNLGLDSINMSEGNQSETLDGLTNIQSNSTKLHLDATFNPVTKVNYVILEKDNFIIENYGDKYNGLSALYSFIESKEFFNYTVDKAKGPLNRIYGRETNKERTAIVNNPTASIQTTSPNQTGQVSKQNKDVTSSHNTFFNSSESKKELLEYINSLSTVELSNLTNSIHPIQKEYNKQHIVLEIWTNGSLHPRDALINAIKNLSETFNALQKFKIYQPIFNESTSYRKVLKTIKSDAGI